MVGAAFVRVRLGAATTARSCRWRRFFWRAPVARGWWPGGHVRVRALLDARARRAPRATVAAGWLRCRADPVPALALRLRFRHQARPLPAARRTLEFPAPARTRRTSCGARS